MKDFRTPPMGRKTVQADGGTFHLDIPGLPELVSAPPSPAIEDPRREKSRILRRLIAIIGEHSVSAERVGVKLTSTDLKLVFEALRAHARSGPAPDFTAHDEIRRYVLGTLFAGLAEEPSNILYTTTTGPDTMRYDAMTPEFWIECLDLLERTISP